MLNTCVFLLIGAQEKTRTSTPIRALAPEASASTNSATWALTGANPEVLIKPQGRVCQSVSPISSGG